MAENHDHVVSPSLYVSVLIALMLLLALTVVAAFVDLDKLLHGGYWNMSLAIVIAICKAVLIILFFMHVKYASRLTWAFASAAFVWLAILLTLTFTDYGSRPNPAESPLPGHRPPPEKTEASEISSAPRFSLSLIGVRQPCQGV